MFELNTPFSIERQSGPPDDLEYSPVLRPAQGEELLENHDKMSKQAEHPTLLVPGPIECDDDVLQSMSHYR